MNYDEDPRYGRCDECGAYGFELSSCPDCDAAVCPFCEHWCDEER